MDVWELCPIGVQATACLKADERGVGVGEFRIMRWGSRELPLAPKSTGSLVPRTWQALPVTVTIR